MNTEALSREEQIAEAERVYAASLETGSARGAQVVAVGRARLNAARRCVWADVVSDADAAYEAEMDRIDKECPA